MMEEEDEPAAQEEEGGASDPGCSADEGGRPRKQPKTSSSRSGETGASLEELLRGAF